MYRLAIGLVSLFFLVASPATAAGNAPSNWVVTQLSGDARVIHPGAQPASLSVNNQLAPGDTLMTGATGRATLVRGADYIIVAPGSELRVPSAPQPAGFTRVMQSLGTLLFKVQHTGIPHFAVETPMLAAVVKGTTFTVVVDHNRTAVQVIQGVVQVSAIDGGMSRMVEGGRTVFLSHDHPKMLLDADKVAVPTSTTSATAITVSSAGESPLATIATLTGGLVRADLSMPQPVVANSVTTISPPTAPITQASVPSSTPVATAVTSAPAATTAAVTTSGSTVPPATAPSGTMPAVTAPATTTPAATTPTVTVPSVTVPSVTVPTVTVPTVTVPTVTVPSVTTPTVTVPTVTVPTVTVPTVTVPTVTVPTVTVPTVTVPSVTTPTVTVPTVTVPTVTVPSVTTPTVTVPTVTVPTVTVPTVTVPTVTVPSVTTPTVTVPTVTVPTVTVPSVTTPTVTVPTVTTPAPSGGLISGLLTTVGNTLGGVLTGGGHP